MELELGLKITRTRDDLTSELRIGKDRGGPLFLSRETEKKFVLTAHLKDYKRERIKIMINEDGTQIAISGEKPIQEMVMEKWIMHKKEAEIRGFCEVFWIPDCVILDQIKAEFNEEDSTLTISMPKKTKGILGLEIEEVKQEHFNDEISETLPIIADKDAEILPIIADKDAAPEESDKEESPKAEPKKSLSDQSTQTEGEPDEAESPKVELKKSFADRWTQTEEEPDKEESPKAELKKSFTDRSTQTEGEPDKEESPKAEVKKSFTDRSTQTQGEPESPKAELKKIFKDGSTQTERWPSRNPPLCPSLFGGSAILVSIIVLVIQVLQKR